MATEIHTNGTEVRATQILPIPKREVWLDVPEYPTWKVLIWVNYPQRLNLELASGEAARVSAAVRQIVIAHNGWIGEDGEPYPVEIDSDEFWKAIPDELAAVLGVLVLTAKFILPKSLGALANVTRTN